MVLTSVFVGVAGLLVASFIATEQGGEPMRFPERPLAALRRALSLVERAGSRAKAAWDRRAADRARRAFAERFSSRDGQWARTHRVERIDWRERLVAVMELILFIAFLSALVAGALAAAALKFGHFHS
jgi:hypothetical protein